MLSKSSQCIFLQPVMSVVDQQGRAIVVDYFLAYQLHVTTRLGAYFDMVVLTVVRMEL